MRIPLWILLLGAALAAVVVVVAGMLLIDPNRPLIASAGFEFEMITPNADGSEDIVPFSYTLARPANVTLSFEAPDGAVYFYREDRPRNAGDHRVLFSGVVDGYTLPGEDFESTIERRLIPNGDYTWTLVAQGTERDEEASQTGTLVVSDGDADLPLIESFTLAPPVFTPNQDGVTDRVGISAVVQKPDVDVDAYLLGEDGQRYVIAPRELPTSPDIQGERYEFDYEGGVDINADPPPNGTYTVVVQAQDLVGQRASRTATLTLEKGGKPIAQIVGETVGYDVLFATRPYDERFYSDASGLGDLIEPPTLAEDLNFNTVVVPLGDMLVFRVVVENYGASPIRTSGPPPGTVYDQRQLAASLGEEGRQQSGVWRVGLQCETSAESYPWRWALGDETTLMTEYDVTSGNTYLYLQPGERAEVWGAVRMTEYVPTTNPQNCYAGLIHEGVAVVNQVVGTRAIQFESTEARAEFNTGTDATAEVQMTAEAMTPEVTESATEISGTLVP
jgi:hypothetical protein